jgi:anti-sigma regulatory factor (Ser/Thr protein kinase)
LDGSLAPAPSGRDESDGRGTAAEALECLAQARQSGRHLRLTASPDSTARLDAWLSGLEEVEGLDAHPAMLLRLAIQEACANIVEHAYGLDPAQRFDIWCVPGPPGGRLRIVFRDQGRTADLANRQPVRFSDREVRKRGRGFGLEIVDRVMTRVVYCPATAEGNLMCLTFDPNQRRPQEVM